MPPAKSSRFAANVLTLAAGSSAAQMIALLALPLLTRLYSPHAFGIFSTFTATTAIAVPLATGRYELAITLPADEARAGAVVRLALLLAIASASLSALLIANSGPALAALIGEPALAPWLWIVPASMVLTAATQALAYWHTRQHAFVPISLGALLDSIVAAATKLALAPVLLAGGLIVGAASGQLVGTLSLLVSSRRPALHIPKAPLLTLSRVLREYRAFPLYDLPNALSYVLATRGSVLLVIASYGGALGGLFAFAEQVLTAPFGILTNAYRQAFYPELVALHRERPEAVPERLHAGMHALIRRLCIPFALGLLLARPLVPLVFGERWAELATYVHILSPPVFLTLVVAPAGHLLQVLQRQDLSLRLNARLLICRLGTLWLAASVIGWDAPVALLAASLMYYLVLLLNVRTMLRQIGAPLPRGIVLLSVAALLWYAYLSVVHSSIRIAG